MFLEDEENETTITMVEHDFGLILPIILIETEGDEIIASDDNFSIKIFKKINTEPIVTKTYTNLENNTINFELTEEESLLLPVGNYYYDLDWYRNGVFLGNIVPKARYIVKEKAGV